MVKNKKVADEQIERIHSTLRRVPKEILSRASEQLDEDKKIAHRKKISLIRNILSLLTSTIAALIATVSSTALISFLLSSWPETPVEQYILIGTSTVVGIAVLVVILISLYYRQKAKRHLLIKRIKESERLLFERIEENILTVAAGEAD